MMEIREVHEDLIPSVKQFLSDREGFRDANAWEGLFNYPWKLREYPYGYAIFDSAKMVGFLGTIFSQRSIAGKSTICCNTSSWFVEDEYRTQMLPLQLFAPILRMKDLLITNLSPTERAREICEKFGYKNLDLEQVAIPVIPGVAAILESMRRRVELCFELGEIHDRLNAEEREIFEDHNKLSCTHFLIRRPQSREYCYGIATTTLFGKLRFLKGQWLNLCYLSNPAVFTRNFPAIKKDLWMNGRFFALRYDARLLPGKLSRIEMRNQITRQYKAKEPVTWTIDNLYSELVTFNKY